MTPADPARPELSPWQAPLVPLALALTAGVVVDRLARVPLEASATAAAACTAAWLIYQGRPQRRLALIYLWAGVACLGGAYHHGCRYRLDATDVSHVADADGVPARLRGTVASAAQVQAARPDALRSGPQKPTTRFVLRVTGRQDLGERVWKPATGAVQVSLVGRRADLTVGDAVELLGRLALPAEPANPGEFDYAAFLRDQGITATLTVLDGDELTVLDRGGPRSLLGWLAVLRGRGQAVLADRLPADVQPVASALLLGDGSALAGDEWEQYLRTGVVHVLAISGQHLVVLAGFLWLVARVLGLRRRRVALVVAGVLVGYALLAGGRPPVMRAGWTVAAYCGGILLQRPVHHANVFALAWTGVVVTNPTDVFNTGCQLSFLAVAVLMWGASRWTAAPADPLRDLVDESRPRPLALLVGLLRATGTAYLVNAVVWLAVTPLVADRYHLVSPVALALGPPLVFLTSIALLAGFLLLLTAWAGPLAEPFAWATQYSLAGCDALVRGAGAVPGCYQFVPDLPGWWLGVFYLALALALMVEPVRRQRAALLGAGVGWLALGVALLLWPHRPGEFRCSFLAVGHGGCTVIETAEGRVLVYDAGAITGPEVTRRHIAPFLWRRGIRHVDEVFLSHADLDHYNGLPALVERFGVGRVTCTPTFAQRNVPGVAETLRAIERAGIPTRIVARGEAWQTDDVRFEVLHPPAAGPAGSENARSLVLRVACAELNLLLTGDLEGPGLAQLLEAPTPPVDVLMAPHHGSEAANGPALASWAAPRVVVSCQAKPRFERKTPAHYERRGATYLATWPHGMVTVRRNEEETWVETYRTGLRRPLR